MIRTTRYTAVYLLLIGLTMNACSFRQGDVPSPRPYTLEQVDETLVVQVYPDGFSALSLQEKVTAYYLYKAAIAGRDIAYDQHHRHALEIRKLLEGVVANPEGIDPADYNKIVHYTKKIWLNNGMYNERTREKFVPEIGYEAFLAAADKAAENGADLGLEPSENIAEKLHKLRRTIFDKSFEPYLTNKSPDDGEDPLLTSANNLYEGVTAVEAKRFQAQAKNNLNAKLTKLEGELVEQVYRAGDSEKGISAGLYSNELTNVIENLREAAKFTTDAQRETILNLIEFFKTGDLNDFRNYNISWLNDNPTVDFINGFIEVYLDVMGQKGEYEGSVFFVDKKKTKLMKDLAANAQYFEQRMPWDEAYKQDKPNIPVANAIAVIVGTGGLGPRSPIGINLPNAQDIRESHGSKSVLLTNIIDAANQATGSLSIKEFALPEEQENAEKYAAVHHEVEVAMHEIIGHGSGKVSSSLKSDPSDVLGDYYSALEEARAELVALYHMFDPKLVEMGILPDENAAEEAYRAYARNDLVQLRRVVTGDVITDDHMKATHLIVQYLKDVTGVIEQITLEEKSFYKVTSIEGMRNGIADLLSQLMKIKAEGDYDAIKKLVDTYGTKIDTRLRDEVVARCAAINYPSFTAFVFPYLEPLYNENKGIIEVRYAMPESFLEQQLRFSNMFREPKEN